MTETAASSINAGTDRPREHRLLEPGLRRLPRGTERYRVKGGGAAREAAGTMAILHDDREYAGAALGKDHDFPSTVFVNQETTSEEDDNENQKFAFS